MVNILSYNLTLLNYFKSRAETQTMKIPLFILPIIVFKFFHIHVMLEKFMTSFFEHQQTFQKATYHLKSIENNSQNVLARKKNKKKALSENIKVV